MESTKANHRNYLGLPVRSHSLKTNRSDECDRISSNSITIKDQFRDKSMNTAEILSYVDSSSSIVKEVFSCITTSKSEATRSAAKSQALSVVKEINDGISASPEAYIRNTPVDVAVAIIDEWSFQKKETLRYKIVVAPFKPLWIKMLAFMYGLNASRLIEMSRNSDRGYFEAGDGIVLAGLYLACKETSI